MTLASLTGVMRWPNLIGGTYNTPAISTAATLDAAGEYWTMVFMAREDMVISHVGWRCGAATGSPTADTRIETVDTDGAPSGTLWATNTNIVSGALATGWTLHALTASATITKGQMFAVKILYQSGTSFTVNCLTNNVNFNVNAGTYCVTNTTGSVVKSASAFRNILALGSSTTVFYPMPHVLPVNIWTANAFNNTSSAARGMRFRVPFPCRCVGLTFWNSTSSGDFNFFIGDDATGAELSSSSTAFDGNHSVNSAAGMVECFFDNPVTLTAGTWYRAVLQPSSATNITIGTITLPSADYMTGVMGGANHHYTTYVASTWTDSATDQFPWLEILVDQLDDGAGAGGGVVARVIGG